MIQILYLIFIVLDTVAARAEIPFQFRRSGRIIGGENTTIEEYPYQVSIKACTHICGGSIINATTILTAAQCVLNNQNNQSIRAGSTYREQGGQVIKIRQTIRHPKYDSRTENYDAAILILESPLKLSETVQPVELPDENEELPVGIFGTITGWGASYEGGCLSSILQKVTMPTISQEICQIAYSGVKITPQMFCVGEYNIGGKDACLGDMGGPVVALNKLHGIVSWGYGCARPQYPRVCTRVTAVRDWIRSVTGL